MIVSCASLFQNAEGSSSNSQGTEERLVFGLNLYIIAAFGICKLPVLIVSGPSAGGMDVDCACNGVRDHQTIQLQISLNEPETKCLYTSIKTMR